MLAEDKSPTKCYVYATRKVDCKIQNPRPEWMDTEYELFGHVIAL